MSPRASAVSLLLLCVAVASCSGSSEKIATQEPSGPVTAIRAFLMAGNEKDYAKAETYVSSGAQESLKRMGGAKGLLDMVTREGTLKNIEVLSEKETVKGRFTLSLQLQFIDDRVSNATYSLIREDGAWKIGL